MLAKSETVSADLRAKPDIADQRAEAGAIARGLTMLFQIIFFLRPVGFGHCDDLSDRSSDRARAIAVPAERLLLTPVPQLVKEPLEIAWLVRQIRHGLVQSSLQKYSASRLPQITPTTPAIPHPLEGRIAIVTDVGRGRRWTRQRRARQ
jgi:hypothetical protein